MVGKNIEIPLIENIFSEFFRKLKVSDFIENLKVSDYKKKSEIHFINYFRKILLNGTEEAYPTDKDIMIPLHFVFSG